MLRSMKGSVVEASVTAAGGGCPRRHSRAASTARVSASSSQLHTARSPAAARPFGGDSQPMAWRIVSRARRSRGT